MEAIAFANAKEPAMSLRRSSQELSRSLRLTRWQEEALARIQGEVGPENATKIVAIGAVTGEYVLGNVRRVP